LIKEFDKIKLKNGNIGYIADKLDETHFYADISDATGEISTVFITADDIASVFEEIEYPLARAV